MMDDLTLARHHAPIVYFDAAEPFLPELVGYAVLERPGPSPTFDRYLNPRLSDGRQAVAIIEYALWTDWDIQHLYELEHVWSYVDANGHLLFAEASWHGGVAPLIQDGQLSCEDNRPVAYAQPGKHAMTATPRLLTEFDVVRAAVARATTQEAGTAGLLVGRPIVGRLEKTPRRDGLANAFLRRRAFAPTFQLTRRWDARETPFCPAVELIERIPSRLEGWLARLEAERSRLPLWAVLFDLGDTLMIEETEEKDETGTTLRAALFEGAADLIWRLRREGYLLGLVADTRPGTARHVLRQHDLEGAFDVCAISEELGCEKPDRRIFAYALHALGISASEAHRVAMVGNNLARDVRGANAAGLVSIWLQHNHRYPTTPADDLERPQFAVSSVAELDALIHRLACA